MCIRDRKYEDKKIQQVKQTLGDIATTLSNDYLRDIATEVQFLSETWLDEFEREIFNGLTLNELLHEKGG